MENWKPIKNYEGLYEISDLGRIKSLSRIVGGKNNTHRKLKEKILKSVNYKIYLAKEESTKFFNVPLLVAQHFVPNTENKTRVSFKDGDNTNICASNLMWVNTVESKRKNRTFDKKDKFRTCITKVENSRGLSQYTTAIYLNILKSLCVEKGESLYFIYENKELILKKEISKNLLHILNEIRGKKFLDFIFENQGIIVKKVKVTGNKQFKITIPTYICEKLNIKDKDVLTYEVLEDCVRINLEV